MSDRTDDHLARFGERLEAIEKHLALIHRDIAAQRAAVEAAAAAIERLERRFEAPEA